MTNFIDMHKNWPKNCLPNRILKFYSCCSECLSYNSQPLLKYIILSPSTYILHKVFPHCADILSSYLTVISALLQLNLLFPHVIRHCIRTYLDIILFSFISFTLHFRLLKYINIFSLHAHCILMFGIFLCSTFSWILFHYIYPTVQYTPKRYYTPYRPQS